MQLETVSSQYINELEQLVTELQLVMRKAGLRNEPVAQTLRDFEVALGQARRARFDAANPEYIGY
jgi:hypothetical protein